MGVTQKEGSQNTAPAPAIAGQRKGFRVGMRFLCSQAQWQDRLGRSLRSSAVVIINTKPINVSASVAKFLCGADRPLTAPGFKQRRRRCPRMARDFLGYLAVAGKELTMEKYV